MVDQSQKWPQEVVTNQNQEFIIRCHATGKTKRNMHMNILKDESD